MKLTLAAAGLILSWTASSPAADFDFYVLSLSWSPSYCEAQGRRADPQQCRAAKPFGFIVHGLWPQRERGYPEFCSTDRDVPRETIRSVIDIMPSAGLIRHEWRKHGTCSRLSRAAYFATVRAAFERIVIPTQFRQVRTRRSVEPQAVETAFAGANPGLRGNAMAVTCADGLVEEVRICLGKDLAFRPCPEIDRRGCRARAVTLPPVGD